VSWLKRLLWRWVTLAIAIAVTANIVPGVTVTGGVGGLVGVAAVLGLANALIRPIIRLLTLPIILVTFGLFAIVINVGMLYLADVVTGDLHFDHFWNAVLAAIIISLFSALFNRMFRQERHAHSEDG
jgi:putative membrane protein